MKKIPCTWLGEVCYSCSLTVLPDPVWVVLNYVWQRIFSPRYSVRGAGTIMTSFYRYLAVPLPPLFTRTALSAWATREGGRQQHATSLSSLSSVAQSINVRASLPASERPNANAVLVCLIGPRSLLCRCTAVAAASSPPRLLLHLPCFLRGGGGGEGEEGAAGRQTSVRP